MPGWDIEEEESEGVNGGLGRAGAEYYGLVIYYDGLKLSHFIPHHVRRDQDGNVMMSTYKKTEPQTEEGSPTTVREERIVKWATKKDTLDGMKQETRQACNAVKAYLGKTKVGLFYHNANQDECAMFGGAHLHAYVKSEVTANGSYKYHHDVNPFRTMKAKCRATKGGYVKCGAVVSKLGLMCHLLQPPRMFIGSNHKDIHTLFLSASKSPLPPSMTLSACLEDDEPEEERKNEAQKRYSSWDDEEPKEKKSSWDEGDTTFVVEGNQRGIVTVKETPSDRVVRVLRLLMTRYRANNMSEMFARIGKVSQDADIQYKALWYRLAARSQTSKLMATTLDYMKCESIGKPFRVLINEFCHQPNTLDGYETAEDSYNYFLLWVGKQGWDTLQFIHDIVDVMDKRLEKVNTVALIGPSNSGKTVMFAQPLVAIARFVGMVGNRGNASEFVYQECVNCRLISMEECIMGPDHYEDLKLIMGGETTKVSVKFQGHATLERTPIILTGNRDPWDLDCTAKAPMMNRMKYYRTQTDNDLKEIKKLHPGMWWYLIQQYEDTQQGLIPLGQLDPYPQPEDCQDVDVDDPLV